MFDIRNTAAYIENKSDAGFLLLHFKYLDITVSFV